MQPHEPSPHSAPAPEARPGLGARLKAAPVTTLLTASYVVYFAAVELLLGSTQRVDVLVRAGALERGRVWDGEVWRLVTAVFLHIGPMHLLWNALVMFSLCGMVERVLGGRRLLLLFLLTGVGASAASLLGHDVVSAGASGAGFGMVGVIMVLVYRMRGSVQAFFADRAVRQNLVVMAIWFVLGATALPMDNFAHGGGLVFGVLFGLAALPPRGAPRRPWAWALPALVLAAAVLLAVRPVAGGSRSAALASLQAAVEADAPDRVQALLAEAPEVVREGAAGRWARGWAAWRSGDLSTARVEADWLVEHVPDSDRGWRLRAVVHQAAGDAAAARADLEQVARLSPEDPVVWRILGELRAEAGDAAGAEAARERAEALEAPPARR